MVLSRRVELSDLLLRMLTVHREESGLWRVWVPAAGGPVSRLPQGSRTKMTDGKGSRYGTGWGVRIAGAWELNGFRGLKEQGVEEASLPVNKFPNAWATCCTPGPWEHARSKSYPPYLPKTQKLAKGAKTSRNCLIA